MKTDDVAPQSMPHRLELAQAPAPRDPRRSPLPFDVVFHNEKDRREVVYISVHGLVYYDTPKKVQQSCTLKSWRRWAKGAPNTDRFKLGDEPDEKRAVKISMALRGQLLSLANRFGGPRGISSPEDETVLALLEIALADVLADEDKMTTFVKVMESRVKGSRIKKDS